MGEWLLVHLSSETVPTVTSITSIIPCQGISSHLNERGVFGRFVFSSSQTLIANVEQILPALFAGRG